MWCSRCNKETSSVPTKTADGICCAMCGKSYYQDKPSEQTIREARDIIARWSSSDLLDQIHTLPQIPELRPTVADRPTAEAITEQPASQNAVKAKPEASETDQTELRPSKPSEEPKSAETDVANVAQSSDLEPQAESSVSTITVAAPTPSTEVDVAPETHTVPTAAKKQTDETEQRKKLPRKPQQRTQRQRKLPAAAIEEGTNSMSRKLRVDSPGGEEFELPTEDPKNSAGGRIQSNSTPGRRHRIDSGSPIPETIQPGSQRSRTQGPSRRRYIDEAHDTVARGPHFEVTPQKRTNLTSITGQFLAYLGVLGLTVGTAMVIYGHFGGYSEYTPTGWLVTTVAQMMLFLGVINLVSGGMEQTNNDVSERMEYLGAQLMRIEQVTEEAMRGPKIAAHRYADPNAPVEEHQHAEAQMTDS